MAESKIFEDNKECNGTEDIDMIVFTEDINKEMTCGSAGLGKTYYNELVTMAEANKIQEGEFAVIEEMARKLGKNIENLSEEEIDELLEKVDSKNITIQRIHNNINQESMRRALEETNEYDISSVKDTSSKEMQK